MNPEIRKTTRGASDVLAFFYGLWSFSALGRSSYEYLFKNPSPANLVPARPSNMRRDERTALCVNAPSPAQKRAVAILFDCTSDDRRCTHIVYRLSSIVRPVYVSYRFALLERFVTV